MSHNETDLSAANAAGYAESCAEESAKYQDKPCEWCCEIMTSPRVFTAPGVVRGSMVEQAACSEECQRELSTPAGRDPDQEDFRADWDGRWSPEPEWDDATGERIH